MPAALRTFVAVEMPAELLTSLEAVQSELKRLGLRARWVRPEGMHLTLKFLGDIPADQAPAAAEALQAAAGGQTAFRLTAAGLGVFPSVRRPRVLWVGLSGATAELAQLQREIDDRFTAAGFHREERDFHGHLTLGRFSERVEGGRIAEALTSYAAAVFGGFDVREVVLFRSDLRPQGPVYTALARAGLKEPFTPEP
jgi:2'-5' RNA ligase